MRSRSSDWDLRIRKTPDEGGWLMKWSKPRFEELRFGFEVTMYIYNR